MATAEQVVTSAMKRLGLVAAGDSPAATDVASGVEALAAILAAFEASSLSGDSVPLDARFEQALVAMLAVRMAEEFGASPGPVLLRDAERGERQIHAAFFVVPRSKFDVALSRTGLRSTYDTEDTDAASVANWAPGTDYALRVLVVNNANAYECTTAGTSAASGGPTGTSDEITDGTCVWCWRRVTER